MDGTFRITFLTHPVLWPVVLAGEAGALEEVLGSQQRLPVTLRGHVIEVTVVVIHLHNDESHLV
jgi:hypothetical protein